MARRVLVLGPLCWAISMLTPGCSPQHDQWAEWRGELQRNRSIWEAHHVQAYRYDLRRYCFCDSIDLLPLVIRVHGDTISDVVDSLSGGPIPPGRWPGYPTVARMFELIGLALDDEAGSFSASYDPVLGYPREVWAGGPPRMTDSGWGIRARVLEYEAHPEADALTRN